MLKNNRKLRNLKENDDALLIGLGIMVVLGIIFIFVLGSQIMNIAMGIFFISIALVIIAVAARMIKKAFSGTKIGKIGDKAGGLLGGWI